ncbi:MAG: TonB-dependent receptor [Bacteroidetes bacterium]|nr:MAG: TonB-dependent receptor [Bacteroidota bacterium]
MRVIFYKYLFGLLFVLIVLPGFSQQITVTGILTDAADGLPLIGVNVISQQKGLGTVSDFDGIYSITVDPNDTLHYSYVGFSDMYVAVAGRSEINLQMTIDAEVLDEVVVVGYGTQKKSDLTGAVSTIKAKELTKIPTASIDQALQGKVSGVQVTPISGEPGAAAVIRIRGVGTLNDASPLFVVDGMLLDDINFLNPYDVESVEVLKDASATAIYGSRGANGVIIITTKKGVKTGDAHIELSAYYGSQSLDKKIALTNAGEFAILANEVAANEGTAPPFDNPEEFNEGTDWQDEIFQTAPIMNYQLAISGASDRMDYRISGNYFKQQGIVKGSDFQRFTLRINNNYHLSSWADIGHNISLIHRNVEVAADVIPSAYRADPTVPPIDSSGDFGNTSARSSVANPVAQIAFNNNSNFGNRAVGNFFIDLKFLKDFTFRSNFGFDVQYNQGKNFVPEFFVSAIQQNDKNRLTLFSNRSQSWLWDNTITYHKEWEKHRLNILGGITAQEFQFEDFGGSRQGLPGESDELWYLSAGEIDGQTNYNSAFEWSMLSYLFRTNYTFDNRLLFTATLRVDGSSKFGKNNRYGYFPSFALGWNVSQESFMESVDFVSRLKLRSSWGVIGNEKIGAYAGRAVVTSNLNAVLGNQPALNFGASIITLANPDIKWEETNQFDIGVEMGFLNNRLSAVIDFYNRVTDGILIDVPIPDYIGSANNPVVNAAKVKNSGFDFDLNWRETKGKFSYSLGLIASMVNNEVIELGEGREEIFGGDLGVGGKLGTRTVVGLPIGAFYGYETDGIFQTLEEIQSSPTIGDERPGDLRFVDRNGDGEITSDDRVYLGSPIPNLLYGFHLGANYAGFDFSIDFNGISGNNIINAKKMARFGTYNFEDTYLDRWTGEGTSDSEPLVTNGGHNYNVSDRFIEDGSFFRLRNIQFGYSLPIEALSKMHLSGLRFYVSGTNLVTWADYSGYTPEITSNSVISVGIDRGVYPIAKTIIGGLSVTF